MREQEVAFKYAKALFEEAVDQNIEEDIMLEFNKITGVINKNKDIYLVFGHPAISKEKKLDIINKIAGSSSLLLQDFLKLLVANKRVYLLNQINAELQRLENQKQGKQIVVAETAVDLNEGEKRKLEDKFSKLLNKKIQLKINVNPSLVGGIKVSTDSTIYDASCFNYLNDLRRKI